MTETDPHRPYRGRFAPSPTGPLHFGSLVAALGSWLLARHYDGEWLIRVEDLDPPREVAGAAQAQLATLAAFGMTSDGPILWQSQRDDAYRQALDHLLTRDAAFACRCSRSDLASVDGIHRQCVASDSRRPPAIRLRVPDTARVAFDDGLQGRITQDVATAVGDFVLRRADGYWAYQLAVVVDDHAQGITDVVRGADLLDSTPRQILLQQALGVPTPRYLHLPLILDAHGQKLSKSMSALPIDDASPLPALLAAWQALGQGPETVTGMPSVSAWMRTASANFAPERLPKVTCMTFAAPHNNAVARAV